MPTGMIAPWRQRTWAARRRVMIIVLTVLRLRRGKKFHSLANKLEHLGFMIPRVLAGDLTRFVEEQRKYTAIAEEVETAKVGRGLACGLGMARGGSLVVRGAPVHACGHAAGSVMKLPRAQRSRCSACRVGPPG